MVSAGAILVRLVSKDKLAVKLDISEATLVRTELISEDKALVEIS